MKNKYITIIIYFVLMSFGAISCEKNPQPSPADEFVGVYTMNEISASTILDINNDHMGSTDLLTEFCTIPNFYIPKHTAEVVKDPYNSIEGEGETCYFVNAQLPYPKYKDTVVESIEYIPVSIRVVFYKRYDGYEFYQNEVRPSAAFNPGGRIYQIDVANIEKDMVEIEMTCSIGSKKVGVRYYYRKN